MQFLIDFLKNTDIRKDLVDISIVSLIIYQFLLIIKGTRAVQMLVGLGLVGGLFYLSFTFELYSLHWILSQFVSSFFIVVVILFQENIRNALINVGGAKFLNRKNKTEIDIVIDEVVEACGALSREKVGGIIVFERSSGLLNYAESGTLLRSELHSDIVYAIFQSSSPLHDGAIIVSNGKLFAAGVFLPLSKNIEIDRHLGTRHRAALGITEQTDAIVVTVSEETGKMSLCFNGIFYHMKDLKTLRNQLRQLLVHESVGYNVRAKVKDV